MKLNELIKRYTKEIKTYSKNDNVGFFRIPDMIWCGLRYGASPANYALFDFRNANHRERKTFLTHRDNEKLMHLFNEQSRYRELEDKIVFASLMGGQYGRRYLDSSSMSYEAFCDLAKEEKLIYKPVAGGQGRGIQVFSVDETNLQSLYNMLKRAPRGIVKPGCSSIPNSIVFTQIRLIRFEFKP